MTLTVALSVLNKDVFTQLDVWTFDCVLVIRHFDLKIWHKIAACPFKIRTWTGTRTAVLADHSACNGGANDTAAGRKGEYLRANGAAMSDRPWARG